jgi:hypothetical protein
MSQAAPRPEIAADRRNDGRYEAVWRAAEHYLRARKSDVHVPLSFGFARRLLETHPEADRDVVLLAILLHDIGWHAFDMADIVEKGFGPGMMKSDLRFAHEKEGVRLSREILAQTGWPRRIIDAVAAIIDGHDTRAVSHSLEDRLVRDADRLWRYTTTGVAVGCDWFRKTPRQYADLLDSQLPGFETDAARDMAREALATARADLMLHLI